MLSKYDNKMKKKKNTVLKEMKLNIYLLVMALSPEST